ncbi:hypothetical protein DFH07DRAFT_51117 [Mycena maculata]|uniref:F-box domain-containing protein n=1 Tax=Mycena maculata TaxID=230809 RepID=A0AAD7N100_9AGAR|nr:hypothetical protein DFH07DRAFT_51117 [Mycena maculata]
MDIANLPTVPPHEVLPVDLMREIFMACAYDAEGKLETDLNSIVDPNNSGMDIHCVLPSVCSHWRTVALQAHELWRNSRAVLRRTDPIYRLLDVLDVWVSRAGESTASLDITVEVEDRLITERLRRYAHRLRALSLHSPNLHVMRRFLDLPPGSVNILETLSIRGVTGSALHRPITVFEGASSLRDVALHGNYTQIKNMNALRVPWCQLTRLSIERTRLTAAQFYSILSQCSALATASLFLDARHHPVTDIDHVQQDVSLPALRALELVTHALAHAAQFMQRISCPELVDLAVFLSSDIMDSSFPAPALPHLRRFMIHCPIGLHRPRADLLLWLRACPAAVHVCLDGIWIPAPMMQQLADGTLLPNLQLLTFWGTEVDALIAMLWARQRSADLATISEVGLRENVWVLSPPQSESVQKLMSVGVFLGNSPEIRPEAGEIEKKVRADFEAGTGPFTMPKGRAHQRRWGLM